MQVDQNGFHGILHGATLIEAELRRQLAPLGIQPRQALVLDAMERMAPVSQTALAGAFAITSASMSTMTDRLLAAGYITRITDPTSRRKNALDLTPEGRALLEGIATAWMAVDKTLTTILGDDATSFFAQAQHLRDALGGKAPGENTARDKSKG